MKRPYRWLAAASLIGPACSSPAAHRGSTDRSASTPQAGPAGPEATAVTPTTATSSGPATTSAGAAEEEQRAPAGPTTTVTVVLPHATTTTTLVLPEKVDAAVSDVEWLVRQTFPEDPDRAAAIAWRESRYQPGADTNPPYVGVMQINVILHAKLIASLGFTTADMYHAIPNLAVARALFNQVGWSPWN